MYLSHEDTLELVSHRNQSVTENKRALSREISAQVAEFLARGGKIEQAVCPQLRLKSVTYLNADGSGFKTGLRWAVEPNQVEPFAVMCREKRNKHSRIVLPGSETGVKPQTARYNAKRSKMKPELSDIPSFVEGTQHCWDCKQTKPLAAFSASLNRKNGVRDQCKECHKAYWKRYVAKRRAAA